MRAGAARAGGRGAAAAIGLILAAGPAAAGPVTVREANPTSSSLTTTDPDSASGGRINGLGIVNGNSSVLYAASEWGGLYKSTDRGVTWARLDTHLPVATWDVKVDPANASKVYATSFFDGRANTRAGISVSSDAGATWIRHPSSGPPAGFCANAADRLEFSAFGIAIDPLNSQNVFIGTACGLARSTSGGAPWTFVDPTPGTPATRIWDVVAQGNGVVDVCGDDGHLHSADGGVSWTAGTGLPSGRCSLAVSPDEPYVLLAVAGTTIYETTNANAPGGAVWTATRSNPQPQGRVPFVATNQRSDAGGANVFDLWFGDVSLYRVTCTTPASPAPGGPPRCGTGNTPAWSTGYTRFAGGHDDMGAIVFDTQVTVDACPVAMSSDGGVYRNTRLTSPDCHVPLWQEPSVTPRGLWPFAMDGADQSGASIEDLYFGNQDNGVFGTLNAGDDPPTWQAAVCCDGFDTAAESDGITYSVCCYGGGRATRFFRAGPGFASPVEINYPPSGLPSGWQYPDNIAKWGPNKLAMITEDSGLQSGGLFITSNIGPTAAWTELGADTAPFSMCGVKAAVDSVGNPMFYVQTQECNSASTFGQLWRFVGTNSSGTWARVAPLPNGGGIGIVAVDPNDFNHLIVSGLTSTTANMYMSTNGGASWTAMPSLDAMMNGGGAFLMKASRAPTDFTGFGNSWQPSLVAFDAVVSNVVVAGGKDSGVFVSTNGGASWQLVTDPIDSGASGVPHIPRPWFAYFDFEPGQTEKVYVGSQGRGIWRLTIEGVSPALVINDVSVAEGDSGTADATFTVSLTPVSANTVTVSWYTTPGTAIQGLDYVNSFGTLTFNPGETVKTLTVPVLGDMRDEPDETFGVILYGATNAVIVDGHGTGTIIDDDPAPSLFISDATVTEGNSGTRPVTFQVALGTTSEKAVYVSYATADGTATSANGTYANPGPIAISTGAAAPASPYPSTISVPSLPGAVSRVRVTLYGFSHTFANDVDVLLVGPRGQKLLLMSDVGGNARLSNVDITFDDAGPPLPGAAFSSGTYRPTDLTDTFGDDVFPAPAPAGPYSATLSVFNGLDPSGTWSLYVRDDFSGDGGSFAGGWSLNFQTTAAGDYEPTSGTLFFNPGETSKSITVMVNGDTAVEPDETFFVNLSNPVNATIADGQGVGTIVNDDLPPVTCPATPVAPGASFTTTVSAGSSSMDWVAVYAMGAPNTPIPPYQYVPLPRPRTLTFTAPAATGTYEVRLFANDGFGLIASCAFQVATGPALSIDDVTVTEGNAGTVTATFTVTLSPTSTGTVTVGFATADGTASAGSDYVATSGTLSFAPGESSKTIAVVVNGDATPEPNETFFVNLTSPSGAMLADAQGVGTIASDDAPAGPVTCPASSVTPGGTFTATVTGGASSLDWIASYAAGAANTPVPPYQYVPLPRPRTLTLTAPSTVGPKELRLFANDTYVLIGSCTYQVATGPALSIGDVTVAEGNVGTTNATFTVTLSPTSTGPVTVGFATADGTATAGSDYVATSGTLSFAPGESIKTITVAINGDTTPEPNETFFVNLASPSGAALADGQGVGTIGNDDAPSGPVSCPFSTVPPGGSFSATVSGGSSSLDWIASYAAGAPNTPVPPYQYVPLPRPRTLTVTAPSTLGPKELRLFANDSYVLIGSCTYQVSTGPALSINDVTVAEGNAGTVSATFTVTLSGTATTTVTVDFATANGTATAGTDYVAASGTLGFAPGESSKTITVAVNGDTTSEPNETFFVNLSGASGAAILDGQGQGTITNDDAPPGPLTCPASPVAPGAAFTTTVTGGASSLDWVASYAAGAPNTPIPPYKYVPLPRPQTVTLTAPGTAGAKELRLFADDGYALIGSCTYQVGP